MTLSYTIEAYLRDLLDSQNPVELRRVDLAERFRCVPSQVNYVLMTRFSPERGYLVESRRGGGGYVRIQRLECPGLMEVIGMLSSNPSISQDEARALLMRLHEADALSRREAAMASAAMDRELLALPVAARDALRARLLRAMLLAAAAM